MSSIHVTTSSTLLTYSLNTMPDPLQASPTQGNTVYGTLSFVVSNSGTVAVQVTQIQFTIPVGTLAQELTNDPDAILYAASPSGQWDISMMSSGVFTAVPKSGQPIVVTTDGLVFQFYNIPVNQQVGTVEITVNETASSSNEESQVRSALFNVAKFPYGFFFANFTPQVPLVDVGQSVTLTWQGSDQASYTMYWGTESADVSQVRTWTSPALTNDTTFLLRATSVLQGETVARDLATTVIVANPELQGSTLSVSGMSSLKDAALSGTLNVSGETTLGAVNASGLSVVGASTLENINASGLGVSGTASFGSLNSGGTAGMYNATINGALNAYGQTTLAGTTVNGALNAKSAPVSMLGDGKLLASGTSIANTQVYANTDGFAVCFITGPGNNGKSSFAYGEIYTIGNWFKILGGTVGSFGTAWTDVMNNNYNCMCLPIKANTYWSYYGTNPSGSQMDSPIYIYWFPMGGASSGKETYRIVEEAEAKKIPIPPPVDMDVYIQDLTEQKQAKASNFISTLGKAFGKDLDKETQDSLTELLIATF